MADRPFLPLIAALVAAVIIFAVVARLDRVATAAESRETLGLTRGAFLDRNGNPLVYSSGTHGRAYAAPDLGPVVGFRDAAGHWHGLEARYQSLLSDAPARKDWRTFFLHLRGASVHGGSVQLTLDPTIQRTAATALGPHQGAVVAIDPRTGGVLALVTHPDCSPASLVTRAGEKSCERAPGSPALDRALDLTVAPGSSFKIVTLTAAIDSGRYSLDSVFTGADIFGPSPYFDNSMYPSNITNSALTQLTLSQALAFSDNFTFAHVGLTLGAPTLLGYAHRYYIGRRIPFDYPVAVSRIANGDPHPDSSVLAQSSFGARTDQVTPLQMALIASTVANGGVLMAPHLVAATRSPTGATLWRYPVHSLDRVMSAASARQVATGMIFDVVAGSGWPAQINGIDVAGKTGTAASGAERPHAWFIAFAPAYHPVIAVAVLREFSGEGFQYAAPVARAVLLAALREHGYHRSPGTPQVP